MESSDLTDLKAIEQILEAQESIAHNPFSPMPNKVLKEALEVLEVHMEENESWQV